MSGRRGISGRRVRVVGGVGKEGEGGGGCREGGEGVGDVGKEGRGVGWLDGVGVGVGDAVEKIRPRVGGPAGVKRTVQSVSQSVMPRRCSVSQKRCHQNGHRARERIHSASILHPGCIKGNRQEK